MVNKQVFGARLGPGIMLGIASDQGPALRVLVCYIGNADLQY